MIYGPNPWQQKQWDWRAAGNFIFGGGGAGLMVFTAISGAGGIAQKVLVLTALGLVGLGLLCVWLELGRPLRAINVFINPRTSWMSRESIAATALMLTGTATVLLMPVLVWAAAGLALAFVYCQARMLNAAKGIVAWREARVVPLIVITGLTEGAGLFLFATSGASDQNAPLTVFGALVALRFVLWRGWRRAVAPRLAKRALAQVDAPGRVLLYLGTALPLAAVVVGMFHVPGVAMVGALAGGVAGAWFKYTLITRAGFNQGFALLQLPIRGARPPS
jgi:phenylacetyl-CoA:acceptor oxidoreductase 26-kDa subunit